MKNLLALLLLAGCSSSSVGSGRVFAETSDGGSPTCPIPTAFGRCPLPPNRPRVMIFCDSNNADGDAGPVGAARGALRQMFTDWGLEITFVGPSFDPATDNSIAYSYAWSGRRIANVVDNNGTVEYYGMLDALAQAINDYHPTHVLGWCGTNDVLDYTDALDPPTCSGPNDPDCTRPDGSHILSWSEKLKAIGDTVVSANDYTQLAFLQLPPIGYVEPDGSIVPTWGTIADRLALMQSLIAQTFSGYDPRRVATFDCGFTLADLAGTSGVDGVHLHDSGFARAAACYWAALASMPSP